MNYGGVYDFGAFSAAALGFVNPVPGGLPDFPDLSAGAVLRRGPSRRFRPGLGSPTDTFTNIPLGCSGRIRGACNPRLTLNYGLRYDVEIPPKFSATAGTGAAGIQPAGITEGNSDRQEQFPAAHRRRLGSHGNGKTVVRASYGMFYDHPLLGLYFLGDASDGSTSGQLAFAGTSVCSGPGNPSNLNAIRFSRDCRSMSRTPRIRARHSNPATGNAPWISCPTNSSFKL